MRDKLMTVHTVKGRAPSQRNALLRFVRIANLPGLTWIRFLVLALGARYREYDHGVLVLGQNGHLQRGVTRLHADVPLQRC